MNNYKLVKNSEWKEVEINGEVKEIPINWEVKKFEDFSSICRGGSPRPIQNFLTDKKEGTPWIKISDATKVKKYIDSTEQYIIKKGESRSRLVYPGDLIVSNSATPGIPRFLNITACIHDGWLLLRDFKGIDKEFLFQLVGMVREKLKSQGSGSIFTNLSIDILSNFECLLPPITQQSAIADILSTQESVIENIEQLISKYESRFQYLSEELLSGRLRVKEEQGQFTLYKNPEDNWKEVEVNGEMKEIPNDWDVERIGNKIKENKKSKLKAKDLTKIDQYPAFNCSKNLSYYCKDFLVDGENLFLSTGGMAAIHYYNGKASYSTDVYSITSNDQDFDLKFGYFILSQNVDKINDMFYGAGLKHLNKTEFKNSQWVTPSLKEQKDIVILLEKQENLINQQKEILAKEKQKFDWLLDNLLSGKYLIQDQ